MSDTRDYTITLPKGEAPKPYYELTETEMKEVGLKIFRRALAMADLFGQKPIISESNAEKAFSKVKNSL